jgi:uncharacterized protein (DUF2267 family)
VEYQEFIAIVAREAGGLDPQPAARATQATLETLAERLARGQAREILQELPAELKPWAYTETDSDPFDLDEFLARVARRDNTDIETAERHARAVFFALGAALSDEAVAHLAGNLPKSWDALVAEAQRRYVPIMPASDFWAQVAEQAGLDADTARRATDAVLETLAERIAGGDVERLVSRLDPLLHPALHRGKASAREGAHRMALEDFLRQVAAREGVDTAEDVLFEQVFEHARAVFSALSEAVGSKEFFDITVQLPAEYSGLIPPRER